MNDLPLNRPCSFCRRPIGECNRDTRCGEIQRARAQRAKLMEGTQVVTHQGTRYALTWEVCLWCEGER